MDNVELSKHPTEVRIVPKEVQEILKRTNQQILKAKSEAETSSEKFRDILTTFLRSKEIDADLRDIQIDPEFRNISIAKTTNTGGNE